MEKIYTQMEQLLIAGAQLLSAKKDTATALALDLQLLEMEQEQGLIDGMEVDSYGI